MGLSDSIEQFIIELMKNEEGWLELKRNELAGIFNCVPSQINYVMTTRFNEQRGYVVESRRGGGGYIRIRRINTADGGIADVLARIGASLDIDSAKAIISYLYDNEFISERELKIMAGGVSDKSITVTQPNKDALRANILKNMLTAIL